MKSLIFLTERRLDITFNLSFFSRLFFWDLAPPVLVFDWWLNSCSKFSFSCCSLICKLIILLGNNFLRDYFDQWTFLGFWWTSLSFLVRDISWLWMNQLTNLTGYLLLIFFSVSTLWLFWLKSAFTSIR